MSVRPLLDADFKDLYRLLSDPGVMRFIRPAYTEEAQAWERFSLWSDYAAKRPGLGTFVITSKEENSFAGFCVARQVAYNPESDEYEIGYIFAPEYWGQGFATELVPALSAYCFGVSAAKHLVAFTDPDNAASQRVLVKGGFRYMGPRQTADGTSAEFWLVRDEVQGQGSKLEGGLLQERF